MKAHISSAVTAVGDALAGLAGTRLDLLARDPAARTRYITLAGALLSTGALATLSAAFTLHMTMNAPWPVAAAFGLFWGAVIVNLDRLLVVSMRHDASGRRNFMIALPRVALALLLGIVIATPVTLQVFHSEIDNEIVDIHREQAAAFIASQANDPTFTKAQGAVADDQEIINSGGKTDPALKPDVDDVAKKQQVYDDALKMLQELQGKAQCELNGTCGTKVPGDGKAYEEAKTAADAQQQVVDAAKAALNAANQKLNADAQAAVDAANQKLKTDQAYFTALTQDRNAQQQNFDDTSAKNSGLLIRLQALGRLTSGNSTLSWAHTILELVFICVELLPVISKSLMLSRPTAYDHLLVHEDQVVIDTLASDRGKRRLLAEDEAELDRDLARDRLAGQKQLGLAVNAEIIAQQRRIITEALRTWGEHTQQVAAAQLAAYQQLLASQRDAAAQTTPIVDGTAAWTAAGRLGRAPSSAPWSDLPGHRPAASSPDPRTATSNGNFTVDDPPGRLRRWMRPNRFLKAADLPSADDL